MSPSSHWLSAAEIFPAIFSVISLYMSSALYMYTINRLFNCAGYQKKTFFKDARSVFSALATCFFTVSSLVSIKAAISLRVLRSS